MKSKFFTSFALKILGLRGRINSRESMRVTERKEQKFPGLDMKRGMNRITALSIAVLLLAGVIFNFLVIRTEAAKKSDYDDDDFTITAELSGSDNGETYDVHIEISNDGPDFDGTVRVIAQNNYSATCAYDTPISLSQGSTKQFTVSIPVSSLSVSSYSSNRSLYVSLVDNKEITFATKTFNRLFDNYMDYVGVGVLSNDFDSLHYLDIYGNYTYLFNDSYKLQLIELDEYLLESELPGLDYLIIDQYDTSSLSSETIEAIENWTRNGGMLIFGTGACVYEVLSGFDPQFLEAECRGIWNLETDSWTYQEDDYADLEELLEDVYEDYYSMPSAFYYMYDLLGTDIAIIPVSYGKNGYEIYSGDISNTGIAAISQGLGSITYLYYSLSDPDVIEAFDERPYMLEQMYQHAASYVSFDSYSFHHAEQSGIAYDYMLNRVLGVIDLDGSELNYNVLKFLIVIYVILIGPIAYLILRQMKKRELYWLAVPAMALLFVGIVSLAGRGFRVADLTVNSVTMINAGENGHGETGSVIYAYSASHEDWQVKLAGHPAYAGPLNPDYGYNYDAEDYYFHVTNDMTGTRIGARPESSFEGALFQCRAENPTAGSIKTEDIEVRHNSARGKVENQTGYDFTYMLVYQDGNLCIIEDVKNGETVELRTVDIMEQVNIGYFTDYFWYVIEPYYDGRRGGSAVAAQLSAMYVPLMQIGNTNSTVVVGVVPEYEKVTDDDCVEAAYGCFYSVE